MEIQSVYAIQFLSVESDHRLCWKPHIKYVWSKISKSIGILRKSIYILDEKSLEMVYNAFINPHLSYCVAVLGTHLKAHHTRFNLTEKDDKDDSSCWVLFFIQIHYFQNQVS